MYLSILYILMMVHHVDAALYLAFQNTAIMSLPVVFCLSVLIVN